MVCVCHVNVPLEAIAGITKNISVASVTQFAEVLLQICNLLVKTLVYLRLQAYMQGCQKSSSANASGLEALGGRQI